MAHRRLHRLPGIVYRRCIRTVSELGGRFLVRRYTHSSRSIRPFRESDLGRIREIHHEAFGDDTAVCLPYYSGGFKNIIYIYEVDEKAVAYAGFYVLLKWISGRLHQVATAFSVAVDELYRRQGIFTTIYRESLSELERNGVQRVNALVDAENAPSLNGHKKLGFSIVDRIADLEGMRTRYQLELVLGEATD